MADDQGQDDMYKARIAELESENAHLRASAKTFGELAERLNLQLREERRKTAERRGDNRGSSDRRVLRMAPQPSHQPEQPATPCGAGARPRRG